MAKIGITGGGSPTPLKGKEYVSSVDNDNERGITGGGAFLSGPKKTIGAASNNAGMGMYPVVKKSPSPVASLIGGIGSFGSGGGEGGSKMDKDECMAAEEWACDKEAAWMKEQQEEARVIADQESCDEELLNLKLDELRAVLLCGWY